MADKKPADFRRRAEIVREIARGIYDREEREAVLRFVEDAERLWDRRRKAKTEGVA
jgi:hypothetical protein